MAVDPPSPLSRFGIFFLSGAVALVLILWGVLRYLDGRHPAESVPVAAAQKAVPSASAPAASSVAPTMTAEERERAQLAENIRQALAVLRDPANPNKKEALEALRQALRQASPKAAIAAIRQFLATGEDAVTGLRFKVAEGGELGEAPSLRTFLMDDLGVLSKGISAQDAAEVARDTLASKGSADEWAVAMRNLAWADPTGSKAVLAAKAREMLNYTPWQQNPSGGYLEAFDTIAYAGDASLIAELAPLAASTSPLQRASLVALQRLSALAPGQVADYLNAHPDVLADRPMLRADYMGNVDLSSPAQLSEAETYLQRADVSQAEKEKFLARLGTPAGFVSNNLLTPPETAVMSLLDHRALVNTTADQWLAAGKFPTLQSPLQALVAQTKPPAP